MRGTELPRLAPSVLEVSGIGLVGAGLWLVAPWVALVVVGAVLVAAGYLLDEGPKP